MGDHTSSDTYTDDSFFNDIDGDGVVNDKKRIIYDKRTDNNNVFVRDDGEHYRPSDPHMPEDRYDPLADFYRKKGTNLRNYDTVYSTEHVTINSSDRIITNKVITDKEIVLSNSLDMVKNSNMITINDSSNIIVNNDLITLTGVNTAPVQLRTLVKIADVSSANFVFTNNSEYVQIVFTHTMSMPTPEYTGSSEAVPPDFGLSGEKVKSDYVIYLHAISGTGDDTHIGNISIPGLLNKYHDVYLTYETVVVGYTLIPIVTTYFHIKLSEAYTGDGVTHTVSVPIHKQYLIMNNNDRYMSVVYTHGIIPQQTSVVNKAYIETDSTVMFENIGGTAVTHINNIALNWLNNRVHKVYVRNSNFNLDPTLDPPDASDDTLDIIADRFYIKLDKKFTGVLSPENYNIKITLKSIGGISLDYINTDNITQYHRVINATSSSYQIEVSKKASFTVSGTGGDKIKVGRVSEFVRSNIFPNEYTIDLPHTFTNVIQIKLINSIIPNTSKTIKSAYNKLYWENVDDGDNLYSITIPKGYYTASELETEINTLISAVPRTSNTSITDSKYSNINNINVTIKENNNTVTFTSTKIASLDNPITFIYPAIPDSATDDTATTATTARQLTINHANHFLDVGDSITISNAVATNGIPASILNATHTILQVTDADNYIIQLPLFPIETTRTATKGGVNVRIDVANQFRLRFDLDDTIGDVLGFRNTGTTNAITRYSSVISNNDLYEGEEEDVSSVKKSVKLRRDDYMILNMGGINSLFNTGPIKDSFSIINLDGPEGSVLYNKHVASTKYFERPLNELRSIDVKFYDTEGNLFDFDDENHSITLAISTVNKHPLGTRIS